MATGQCGVFAVTSDINCSIIPDAFIAQITVFPDSLEGCNTWSAPGFGYSDPMDFGTFEFGPFEGPSVTINISCSNDTSCVFPLTIQNPCFDNSCNITATVLDSITCVDATPGSQGGLITQILVRNGDAQGSYTWTTSTGDFSGQGVFNEIITIGPIPANATGALEIFFTANNSPNCGTSVVMVNPCTGNTCPLEIYVADTTWATCGSADGTVTFQLEGQVEPYQIIYTDANGVSGSVTNTNVVTGLASGQYTFELVDATDFCTATTDYVIPEINDIDLVFVQGADCVSNTITAIPTGGAEPYTYAWNTGETTASIVPTSLNQVYIVTVTDGNGCTEVSATFANQFNPLTIVDSLDIRNATCGLENGMIFPFVFGGSQPYAYLWSDGSTSFNLTDLGPGTYGLTVTDANGCEVSNSYEIGVNQLNIFVSPFEAFICDNSTVDLLVFTGNDGNTSDILYTWTNEAGDVVGTGDTITVGEAGIYTVTATVAGSPECENTAFVEVFNADESDFDGEIIIFNQNDSIGFCGLFLYYTGNPINSQFAEWTLPNGEVIFGNYIEANLYGPGLYIATAYLPNTGCAVSDSIFILPEQLICTNLDGRVYLDSDLNCSPGADEAGLPQQLVQLTAASSGVEFFAFTDESGNWSATVPSGDDYSVQVIAPNDLFGTCAAQVVTATDGGNAFIQIPLQPFGDCPRVTVDLSIPLIRRCFNNRIWLNYENTGTALAEDVVIRLEIGEWADNAEPFLQPFPNSITLNPETGIRTAEWIIGDLAPFAGGNLSLFVYTCNNDAPLGAAACVIATAEPNNPCPPADPAWTGASVFVEGTCTQDSVFFTLSNVGDASMSVPLSYIVIEDGVILNPNPTLGDPLGIGESMLVSLPANGSTWHLQAMQEPLHPGLLMPIDFVEGCGGDPGSLGFALQFPVSDDAFYIDEDCQPIIGAYDPNDKQAEPRGYGENNYIVKDQTIDYTIRFQNTGTDTAFTVVVRDTLSELLDMSTIQILNASHRMRIHTDSSSRALAFIFEDIQLVDSFANEPLSHGALSFRISPIADLEPGTVIENTAAIYFDFNEAVITNTYFHTVEEDFVVVSIFDFTPEVAELSVYPNPTAGTAEIKLPEALNNETLQLEVFDAFGRLLHNYRYGAGERPAVDLGGFPAGWYTLRLSDGQSLLGTGRVLLEKK